MSVIEESSRNYLTAYHPGLIDTESPVWKFQEQLRIVEAKNHLPSPIEITKGDNASLQRDYDYDRDRVARGWPALNSIREAIEIEKKKTAETTEFVKFVEDKLSALNESSALDSEKGNVRRIVKDVWTWPLKGYVPWTKVESSKSIESVKLMELADEILASDEMVDAIRPQLIDGKIYLTLRNFRSCLWKRAAELGINIGRLIIPTDIPSEYKSIRPLTENTESEHITLVNSDVLATILSDDNRNHNDLKHRKLDELLAKWSEGIAETVEKKEEQKKKFVFVSSGLMHTISLDWAPFGICLVLSINVAACPALTEFLADFNSTLLPESTSPVKLGSVHITIAVDSRN